MMTEAIRAHLVECGVPGAENWTHEQVMHHIDNTMFMCSEMAPERFGEIIDDFWNRIRTNMLTVNSILHKDLRL